MKPRRTEFKEYEDWLVCIYMAFPHELKPETFFKNEIVNIPFKVDQASTGPKGKVKTEALKKEREAQVLKPSPILGCNPHLSEMWKTMKCLKLTEHAGCCRIRKLVV